MTLTVARGATSPAASLAAGEAVVALEGVRFAWPGREAFALAVDRFVLARGERLLLTGPSGVGKSTLLSLICGIVAPSQGTATVLGTDLVRLKSGARDQFRGAHFGIIFQMFNLVPYLSVLDNVLLPLRFSQERHARAGGRAVAGEAARRLLARLGLEDPALARRPAADLSVGQQQRVAAARALIGAPEILVADEPTSALDRDRQEAFLELLFAEVARVRASLVMVSHDTSLGRRFDRVERLEDIARTGGTGAAP